MDFDVPIQTTVHVVISAQACRCLLCQQASGIPGVLCVQKPGLIHAMVVLHGEKGPWSNRPGFDEVGAAVSGLFALEGSPTRPKQLVIVPICDNEVAWLGTTGILAALRRPAIEGGSYRVVISLTRVVLWLLSLGILDKA